MVLLFFPGFQPLAFILAGASFLFTLIPGLQPYAAVTLAIAF